MPVVAWGDFIGEQESSNSGFQATCGKLLHPQLERFHCTLSQAVGGRVIWCYSHVPYTIRFEKFFKITTCKI